MVVANLDYKTYVILYIKSQALKTLKSSLTNIAIAVGMSLFPSSLRAEMKALPV